mmetsp:Transcript_7710/g.11171  ORF Transcript_7710/g.11171 Transcript_7710/m.11171 type:complete len:260 (-) Transcript_7710:42-821(-)|eukprot:CAMPEP_0201691628 /NCGR_PEP_ID=MMETSP0578-20130828/4753_1 /ASSEMBLY_ACC=CAM_ASM_000663 /TAXON_ID=267565 /ORGANISM="Skeletonema grethea, Strain CCMP 1804" /LENGTH=259 /DNA_ID=CAMNT_0048176877 /DNA_START=209 /DNA_END=988 /DNA_ORIENTATION=+
MVAKVSRAGFLLVLILSINESASFSTSTRPPCAHRYDDITSRQQSFSGRSISHLQRRNRSRVSHLHSSIDTPLRPIEDEREKDKESNKNSKEWKEVVGGFVPRLFKRPKEGDNRGDNRPVDTSVQLIDTIQDYKKEVVDEQERIVAVRFFAPWCKSCKAAHPHFKKIVSRHSPNVKFVDVPLTKETAYIHEGLGVPSVPFGHIYHPDAGLVEEMKINKKVIGEFGDALKSYVNGSCDLPLDEECVEFEVEAETEADGFQ